EPGPAAVEIDIDSRRLENGALQLSDVRDLAADVEVKQFEAVGHAAGLETLELAKHFRNRQSELRPIATAGLPASRATGSEFDTHPDRGADADLLAVAKDQPEFADLLDNRDHGAPDLLSQERHTNEVVVLEPVADNRHLGVGH